MKIDKGSFINDFINKNLRQYSIPVYQRNYEWSAEQCEKLFEDIKENLIYKECDVSNCLQPQLQYPSKPSPERGAFWKGYHLKGYNYVIKKYVKVGFIGRQVKGFIIKVLDKLGLLSIARKILGRD